MALSVNYLKEYKKIKRKFAKTFEYDQYTVQRAIDQLITYALANGGNITTAEIVALAEPEESLIHAVFNWDSSPAEREAVAETLMDKFNYYVTSSDKVYKIEKQ